MKGFTRDGTLFKVINSMCSSLVSHDWDSNLPIPISKFDFCFIILWHHIRCLSRFFFLIFFSLVVPRCFLFSVFLTISFNAKYQGLNAVVSVAHHTQTKKKKKEEYFLHKQYNFWTNWIRKLQDQFLSWDGWNDWIIIWLDLTLQWSVPVTCIYINWMKGNFAQMEH